MRTLLIAALAALLSLTACANQRPCSQDEWLVNPNLPLGAPMFNLLIVAAVGAAAWYFWPQIVAFVTPYLPSGE